MYMYLTLTAYFMTTFPVPFTPRMVPFTSILPSYSQLFLSGERNARISVVMN